MTFGCLIVTSGCQIIALSAKLLSLGFKLTPLRVNLAIGHLRWKIVICGYWMFTIVCEIGNFECQWKHLWAQFSYLEGTWWVQGKQPFWVWRIFPLLLVWIIIVINNIDVQNCSAAWQKTVKSNSINFDILDCSCRRNLPKNGLAQEFYRKVHPTLNVNLWAFSRHFNWNPNCGNWYFALGARLSFFVPI